LSHWVLQTGWEDEPGWVVMLDTLARFDIPYSLHKVVPFIGELQPEPELASDDAICMGSYAMRHYAKKKRWNHGVFDLEPYDFREQREHWGAHMLNADSEIVAFRDVRFDDGPRFIRPVDDTKTFTGKVFEPAEFADWQLKVIALKDGDASSVSADTVVQVSTPKEIYQEVRCWVVEGRVVTASVYKAGSRVIYSDQVDPGIIEFASALVVPDAPDSWNPQKAFCLDICDTPNGLKIVEINTINSAGFYAADMQKLVMSLDGLRR
jgi:hypothetical protein